MRIICLITVGAFLLSIAIAESDVPIGATDYQRTTRSIILEPMMKIKPNNKENPMNWFMKMFSQAIEPPKKPPPVIGPINFPGMGGHIYIRQVEKNLMPWEPNHVIIKLVSRDPVMGNTLPMDASSFHHRPEDPSRRAATTYGYQPINNNISPRPNSNIMHSGFVPVSHQPQYSSWNAQAHRSRYQHQVHRYSKPFRASTPNDFRYDNYAKEPDQGYFKGFTENSVHRRPNHINYHQHFTPGLAQPLNALPQPSVYRSMGHQPLSANAVYSSNNYNDRFKDNQKTEQEADKLYGDSAKPDSLRPTQLPYPEYPGLPDEETAESTKADNVTFAEHTSASPFENSSRYRQVVRSDRMVSDVGRSSQPRSISRGKNTVSQSRSSRSRKFREGTKFDAKFSVGDVGGIEVITAPNLQSGWENYESEKSPDDVSDSSASWDSDSTMNKEEDTVSVKNENNLARGESTEHSNERTKSQSEDIYEPASRSAQARRSSYRTIDRSHRSQGSRGESNSTEKNKSNTEVFSEKIIGDRRNTTAEGKVKASGAQQPSFEVETKATTMNVTGEVVRKVANLTGSNRWRSQGRRTPRVVKAIYRRKPVAGIIKSSAESMESSGSSEDKSSTESSSSEN